MLRRVLFAILALGIISSRLQAQDNKKVSLKDTLDNALDFSDYLINMHGFIPWPTIISEPALGNFGGALALVFISPKKSMKEEQQFRFPDINGVGGMYTLNNSWGVAGLRQASIPSIGMRYTVAFGYCDVNMDFYRESEFLGEVKRTFGLKPWFAMADVNENVYKHKIFVGLKYIYTKTRIDYHAPLVDSIPIIAEIFDIPDEFEFDQQLGLLGFYVDVDFRNSMFTPDKGIRWMTTYYTSSSLTASDFELDRLETFVNAFFQPYKPWVCGLKAEYQIVTQDAPFYYYPYLNMRGFPMMRYQGQQTLLFETEQRFDITRRWSVVGFVGTGRTFSDEDYMKDNTWHVAGGGGFRYLIARLFGLRMGVDIAVGPDQVSYYIIFGHNWDR